VPLNLNLLLIRLNTLKIRACVKRKDVENFLKVKRAARVALVEQVSVWSAEYEEIPREQLTSKAHAEFQWLKAP
jgi:hypothetical protein